MGTFNPQQPISEYNYPGMENGDSYRGNDIQAYPDYQPEANNPPPPPGETPRQSLLQPTGDADKDRAIIIRFFGDVFRQGVEDAMDRWGWTDDDLNRIMEGQGLSPEQISNLKENKQFRDGIRSGELPSPDLRDALSDIEGLEGKMNEVLNQAGQTDRTRTVADQAAWTVRHEGYNQQTQAGFDRGENLVKSEGRTPVTAELWRMGRDRLEEKGLTPTLGLGLKRAADITEAGGQTAQIQELFNLGTELVKERGFTPEFRSAFDRLLDVVGADDSTRGGNILHPAYAALQKIIQSEGSEGAGILPLEDVVGLVEAQAGQRSAQIAEAAQRESARRGLGPGAVTSGTEVGAESGQLQLNQETAAVGQAVSNNQALRGAAVSSALQNLTRLAEIQNNDPIRGKQADVLGELIRATVTNIQTGASLGVGSQRLANERLVAGLQSTAALSGIAAGREATGAQLATSAGTLETQRVGMGLRTMADFGNIAAGREATGFQSLLGAEGLEQGNRQHAADTILRGNEIQGNVGVSLQQQLLDSLGQSGATAQQGQQNYLQAINMQRLPGFASLDLARQAVGSLGGPAGLQSGPPWWLDLAVAGISGGANVAAGRQAGS